MRKKIYNATIIALVVFLLAITVVNQYRNNRLQADIDTKFMSDYGNLIIGMLNKSIQTDAAAIHKYDVENTKYGYRLVELYSQNSYLKHPVFNDIILLLEQASGCDACYEINMNKELYDKLNSLGQAIFSKPQKYSQEMLEQVWKALSESVEFNVK